VGGQGLDHSADFDESGQRFQQVADKHFADSGINRIPPAWLLLKVIDFVYFGTGQERWCFSLSHAVAFERYAVVVVNNTVQDRVG